ncbi:MAG: hypothetical protein HKN16_04220, partial [Saprospiraceae bacterium]|nr:hypothetical protein [Saprospiraceae bacterium]
MKNVLRFYSNLFLSSTLLSLLLFISQNGYSQITPIEIKVGVVADYDTWKHRGNLSHQEIIQRMWDVSTLFSLAFLDSDYEVEISLPEVLRLIVMDPNVLNISSPADYCGIQSEVSDYFVGAAGHQCVDLIVFLRYSNSSSSANGGCSNSILGQNNGTPVITVDWNPNDRLEFGTYSNILAHEIGHAFGAPHVETYLGEALCNLKLEDQYLEFEALLPAYALKEKKVSHLMCSPGDAGATIISAELMNPTTKGIIEFEFEQNKNDLFFPENDPCGNCQFVSQLIPETTEPSNASCGIDDSFQISAVFQNDCDYPKTATIEIVAFETEAEIFLPKSGWTYHYNAGTGNTVFRKLNVQLAKDEKLQIDFLAKIPQDFNSPELKIWSSFINPPPPGGFIPPWQGYGTGILNSLPISISPRYSTKIGSDGGTVYLSHLIANEKILPFGVGQTQDLTLEGTLIVDQDYTFGAAQGEESRISVDVISKIIVANGSTLNLNSVFLDNCQDAMWDGIEVENGGVLQVENCRIYNAKTGIKSTPWSYVQVTNTEFFNNRIGVQIQGGSGSPAVYSDLGPFYGNWIHSNGNLLWPHKGEKTETGLIVQDNPSLIIGAPYPGVNDTPIFGVSGTTRFEGLENGVIIRNGNLRMENSTFSNIENIAIDHADGILVYKSDQEQGVTFKNVGTAFKGTRSTFDVQGHLILDSDNGIILNESPYLKSTIANNRIKNFKHHAIQFWNVEEFDILQNEITSGPDTWPYVAGIAVNSLYTGQADKLICENSINMQKGSRGIYLYGTEYASLKNNSILLGENARAGIYLGGGAMIDVSDNLISNNFSLPY